ncbi:MAG: glycosyltransferase [Caldiserica bacterium]|nr:glycosyltransferase [Caldisericota bacterium]
MLETDKPVVPVTVVIPCYCCADTIERAVLSVNAQSAKPCQMILVDDGSPDNNATHDKLVELQAQFSHLQPIETVFLQRRGGPGAARNAGWNQATGEYVAFLDADDAWHPEKLAVQYRWMSTHADLALCGARMRVISGNNPPREDPIAVRRAVVISKFSLLARNSLPTPTVMLRRDLDHRFVPEQMRSEDYLLWLEVVSSGRLAMKLDTVLAYSFKPLYGTAGQAGDLRAMERAELQVLKRVHEAGYVGLLSWRVLSWWSVLKHLVRLVRVSLRRSGEAPGRQGAQHGTPVVDRTPQRARPLRLMLVVTWLAQGGAEIQVGELACENARRGAQVVVVSMVRPVALVEDLTRAGVEVVSLGMTKGMPDVRGIVRLSRQIRRFRPDVVHSHMVHANFLARVTRLFCQMPVLICTAHSTREGPRWRELLYRLTDRLADLTTNVSQAGVERYIRVGAAPVDRIRWVPNGIDVSRFERDSARHERLRASLGFPGAFVFLAAARLERAKGIDILLDASSLMHLQGRNVAVLIAGDGSQRAELEAQASTLRLGERSVRFLGAREDIPDLMEAVDALVLPSRWEGLPMVLLEAGAAGLPVIATNVGGVAEIVRNGTTGFLVSPDDPEALARAMVRLVMLSPEERSAMGRNGRRIVEERYSLSNIVDRWEQLYAEVARQRASADCAR